MPKNGKVKIALVGCGKIGAKHLGAYRKMPDVDIVLCDELPAQAKKLADEFTLPSSDSVDTVLADPLVDGVDVCVPTSHHASLVLKALEAGKHVFCEKPLCQTVEEAALIKKKQAEMKKTVMTGYCYRFHPAHELVKKVLQDHVIGKPYFALFRLGGRGGHESWKHDSSSGGGALLEMLVHDLDLVHWFFGEVRVRPAFAMETVLPVRSIQGKNTEVSAEDCVVAWLESKSGVRILCESDLFTPSFMKYFEIQGENGSVFASPLPYLPTIVFCREARGIFNQGNNFFTFPAVDFFEKELTVFTDAVRRNAPLADGFEDSVRLIEVVDQIRHGKKARLPVCP